MKIKCDDFNLKATLDSGQIFGFHPEEGYHQGILFGNPVELSQEGHFIHLKSPLRIPESRVRSFFDLDRDLTQFYRILRCEPELGMPLRKFQGLRLIRQDPWEALATFILSSNNNVKRIQGIHKNMCEYYSRRRDSERLGFPTAMEISKTHERILRQLGLGYRAPFLLKTAQFLSNNPEYLQAVREAEYREAVERVMAFPGIGPKVADCVLLYGFNRLDAFPVDVWILRAMRKFYFKNRKVDEKKVHAFGRQRWGGMAGYVQQYMFHACRTGLYEF